MPITKHHCSNCPFRKDGAGVESCEGRLQNIVTGLLVDDWVLSCRLMCEHF